MRLLLISAFAFFVVSFSFADGPDGDLERSSKGYIFQDEIVLPSTSVKNQYGTSTCWSFSTLSFLESEMLRLGKPEVDLSEMFIVWYTYTEKAQKNIRLHGSLDIGAGGAFHDVTNVIMKYGIVPESVFTGLKPGKKRHSHDEMDALIKKNVNQIIESKDEKMNSSWLENIKSSLDNYLGKIPESFEFNNKKYTPQSFANEYIGLNIADYVEITSYTHHPFYSSFILEVPDNWSWDEIYNVPLNEMEEIIDTSLTKGFTIAWAADITEKGFEADDRIAVLPTAPFEDMSYKEIKRWESLTEEDKEKELYKLDKIVPEVNVTQEMRQLAFDNYETTDDHGMHIVGLAKNQEGKTFYKVKNSWGEYNKFDGFFYASKPYISYKTMSIMVHKDAIPMHIRKKLAL